MPWVEEPQWTPDDAAILNNYLSSETGKKFGKIMLNMTLKTNANCISKNKDLEFEAGFANGFRGAITAIESLADEHLHGELDNEGEPDFLETNGSHTFDETYRR